MTDLPDWGEVKARLAIQAGAGERDVRTMVNCADIRAALERVEEVKQWRYFAWAICPHVGKYGDDGEMQCNGEDFRRSDVKPLTAHVVVALQEYSAALRQRVEELEGESRVLIGCPCWCHTGDGPEPHGDCRECVRGTSTPTRIERDHTEALWQEKWKAALDLMASQAERAEAAEQRLRELEGEK